MDMFRKLLHVTLAPMAGILALIIFLPVLANSQSSDYEEIVINLDIPRLFDKDVFVQYDGQTIYLPVIEIFSLLELKIYHDQPARKIHGFIISEDDKYEIDIGQGVVKSGDQEFELTRDMYFYNGHELYLRDNLFKLFFDLNAKFDFTKLKVTLPLNKDFPAFKRLKRKKAQEKLLIKKEVEKKIYALPFKRAMLKGGVFDWTLSANPIGNQKTQFFGINTGGMLLGGDLTISGTGNTRKGFETEDLRYKWHYFFANNKYITQAELGNVYAGGRISRSLKGLLATNKPQVRRKYFQTIRLNDYIGPDWEVELYIDHRLTDFTRTNDQGIYDFNVDIYYGASLITLKMYGPSGEIREKETNVKIPYNLIPKNEVEYAISFGHDDNPLSAGIYGQANCFYGITTNLTAGISADVPFSVEETKSNIILPKTESGTAENTGPEFTGAAELSYQPLSNLTFNGYVAPGYAVNSGINFNQPSIISINGSFTHFYGPGIRNPFGRLQTFAISFSSPLRIGSRRLGLRCNTYIDRLPHSTEINTNYGFSTSISRIYINYFGKHAIETNLDNGIKKTVLGSQLLISTTLINWIRPQFRVDFDHTRNKLKVYGAYLTKRIFRTGQIALSYEKNVPSNTFLFSVSLTLYTNFASFTSRGMTSGKEIAVKQSQHGSIRYNQEAGMIHFDRRSGVGQGSAILRPFIDKNYDGKYDEDDEPISGMTAKIKGSYGRLSSNGEVFYFDRLRAYDEYEVEINEYSLDNPLLKPVHEGYRMHFNPNMVTAINVPIVMAGEINGIVRRQTSQGQAGLGGVKIELVNLSTGEKTEITTFNNGEFYYLGLIPGRYRAQIDQVQLDSYGYKTLPGYIDFELEPSDTGLMVENIDFLLLPR